MKTLLFRDERGVSDYKTIYVDTTYANILT